MNDITHDELVARARTFLLNDLHCGFAFCEMVAAVHNGEIPDAIGFRSGGAISVLIECKTSRSDFLADGKKMCRTEHVQGMGNVRYYMAPQGMVDANECPDGWGLIEVRRHGGNLAAERVLGPEGQIRKTRIEEEYWHDANKHCERSLMYSALHRMQKDGALDAVVNERVAA
jgi:hypothetical protein